MERPSSIFKFESINKLSLRNLKDAKIFFRRPSDFNDPFDCVSWIDTSFENEDDLVRLFNQSIDEGVIQGFVKVGSYEEVPEFFVEAITKSLPITLENQMLHLSNGIGRTCFSALKNNLLMWAHYADGHRGMCLEFDTATAPFNQVRPVSYGLEYPKLNAIDVALNKRPMIDTLDDDLLRPLLTKAPEWSYEEEWRVFHTKPDHSYTYEVSALQAVYFGAKASTTDIEIVCLILQGQCDSVRFYQAVQSTNSYELSFEEREYTPYNALNRRK